MGRGFGQPLGPCAGKWIRPGPLGSCAGKPPLPGLLKGFGFRSPEGLWWAGRVSRHVIVNILKFDGTCPTLQMFREMRQKKQLEGGQSRSRRPSNTPKTRAPRTISQCSDEHCTGMKDALQHRPSGCDTSRVSETTQHSRPGYQAPARSRAAPCRRLGFFRCE